MSDVTERLYAIEQRFSGRYALYAEHLGTGEVVAHGEIRPMDTASCIKLPIMAETFRQVEEGTLALSDPIVLTGVDQAAGSGVLQHLTPGLAMTLRDVIMLMITVSDNTATNMVLRTVGLSSVNAAMTALGLENTRVLKRIDWSEGPGPIGHSTPQDLAALLKAIYRRELVSPAQSEAMWEILTRQQINTLQTRALPYEFLTSDGDASPRVIVGSKSGCVRGVRNDAGLVLTPWGDYAVVVMSEGCQDRRFHPDNEATVLLPEVTRAVFDHFVGAMAGNHAICIDRPQS